MPTQTPDLEPIIAIVLVLVIVLSFIEGGLSIINLLVALLLLLVVLWLLRGVTAYW